MIPKVLCFKDQSGRITIIPDATSIMVYPPDEDYSGMLTYRRASEHGRSHMVGKIVYVSVGRIEP